MYITNNLILLLRVSNKYLIKENIQQKHLISSEYYNRNNTKVFTIDL